MTVHLRFDLESDQPTSVGPSPRSSKIHRARTDLDLEAAQAGQQAPTRRRDPRPEGRAAAA